jgi:hypothetical protein
VSPTVPAFYADRHSLEEGFDAPAIRTRMEQFFDDVERSVEDVSIASPYDPENSFQVSDDRKIAYAELNFGKREQEEYVDDAEVVKDLWKEIEVDGLQVELGGDIFAEFSEPNSEAFGIVAAIIILLIAFGCSWRGYPDRDRFVRRRLWCSHNRRLTRFLAVPDSRPRRRADRHRRRYRLRPSDVTRYRQDLHDGMGRKMPARSRWIRPAVRCYSQASQW